MDAAVKRAVSPRRPWINTLTVCIAMALSQYGHHTAVRAGATLIYGCGYKRTYGKTPCFFPDKVRISPFKKPIATLIPVLI